jgi:hypothetical protein
MNITDEREFNRYSIAIHDFEKAIEFLDESEKNIGNCTIYESLLISAVISYFRPFTENEKDKESNAISKININAFSALTEADMSTHNKCKEIRNKALAHSEWSKYPTRVRQDETVIRSRFYSILSEDILWLELRNLANKLLNQCHNRRAEYHRERPRSMGKR